VFVHCNKEFSQPDAKYRQLTHVILLHMNFRHRLEESCKILSAFVVEYQYFMNYKFRIYDTLTNFSWLLRIPYLADNSAKIE